MGTRISFYKFDSGGVLGGKLEKVKDRGRRTSQETITVSIREMGFRVKK